MPAQADCPSCRNPMLVPDGAAGAQIACPHCRGAMLVDMAAGRVLLQPAHVSVNEPAATPRRKRWPTA